MREAITTWVCPMVVEKARCLAARQQLSLSGYVEKLIEKDVEDHEELILTDADLDEALDSANGRAVFHSTDDAIKYLDEITTGTAI
jgi:hypothetical protein